MSVTRPGQCEVCGTRLKPSKLLPSHRLCYVHDVFSGASDGAISRARDNWDLALAYEELKAERECEAVWNEYGLTRGRVTL